MTRPVDYGHPRHVWRHVQKMARIADIVCPRWWDNMHSIEALTFGETPAEYRCWEQLIRQRRGD